MEANFEDFDVLGFIDEKLGQFGFVREDSVLNINLDAYYVDIRLSEGENRPIIGRLWYDTLMGKGFDGLSSNHWFLDTYGMKPMDDLSPLAYSFADSGQRITMRLMFTLRTKTPFYDSNGKQEDFSRQLSDETRYHNL